MVKLGAGRLMSGGEPPLLQPVAARASAATRAAERKIVRVATLLMIKEVSLGWEEKQVPPLRCRDAATSVGMTAVGWVEIRSSPHLCEPLRCTQGRLWGTPLEWAIRL